MNEIVTHYSRLYKREEMLRLVPDGKSVFLLGYTFEVTPTEYKILDVLMKTNEPVSKREFVENYLSGEMAKESSIAVHVCNINKKAYRISGRLLIVGHRLKGYELNKYM